jgi:hypothetical protein
MMEAQGWQGFQRTMSGSRVHLEVERENFLTERG